MGHKLKQNKVVNSRADFFYHMFRNILLFGIPLLIVSGLVLSHLYLNSSAISSDSDSLNISISSACTLSSSTDSAHTVSVNAGSYTADIGNTKINAYCNDNNGYSIYAIGSSNNVDGNTDLVSSINDNYNIHTGIYDENNISPNAPSSWSMKLTAGSGSGDNITPPTIANGYNNYNVVPENYTLVASRSSSTNMTIDTDITGSYFTTTYDIYASSVQPPGTYSGKVKYLMVHPQSNNTISDIDAAFAVAGKQKVYQDNNGSYYAMQDMTTSICDSVSHNGERTATQLVDIRDNKLYWATKLKDGHCWMTQNLDFDIVSYINEQGQEVMKSLTSEDTDLTDHSLTGAYSQANGYSYDSATGITTWTPASTAKTINFTGTTVTGWQNSDTKPYSASKTDNTNTGHASLGNYYNWTAAIASNNSSTITGNTLSNISQNPKNSICPKGWRLPTASNDDPSTAGSTNEFARLNYLYNNNSTSTGIKLMELPLYFMMAGRTNNNAFEYGNIQGFYWSNTNSTGNQAYTFGLSTNSVTINGSSAIKDTGRSLRCLTR